MLRLYKFIDNLSRDFANLNQQSRNQQRKLLASGLPQDYLDSEFKILNNLEVILRLKKGFELRSFTSFCSSLVKSEVIRK
jgi:hypothetical protein